MTVNTYLKDLASNLVLNGAEKDHIIKSINTINQRLDLYFSDVTEKKVFGSYVRGTILPRKVDNRSDIDIMIATGVDIDLLSTQFLDDSIFAFRITHQNIILRAER